VKAGEQIPTLGYQSLQPKLDDATVFDLGRPRFTVTYLPREATHPHPGSPHEEGSSQDPLALEDAGRTGYEDGQIMETVSVAAAFRRVAERAAGWSRDDGGDGIVGEGGQGHPVASSSLDNAAVHEDGSGPPRYGPWRPFLAPVLTNRRLTAEGHFQDVRCGSGCQVWGGSCPVQIDGNL
jgi:hypothetical protein